VRGTAFRFWAEVDVTSHAKLARENFANCAWTENQVCYFSVRIILFHYFAFTWLKMVTALADLEMWSFGFSGDRLATIPAVPNRLRGSE
jgi:hypothetical protein